MKFTGWIVVLLISIVSTSMTQCPRCIKSDLKIDNDAKRWLPYRAKDSVAFISTSGILTKFRCYFGDTAREYKNFDCDDSYTADSIGASIEIAPSDSLYISCTLSSPSWLSFMVRGRNMYFISGGNVLNGPETEMRKKISDLVLNNVLYHDVRLVNAYPGTNPAFDSLYFVKDYGVVSFVYNNVRYFLNH